MLLPARVPSGQAAPEEERPAQHSGYDGDNLAHTFGYQASSGVGTLTMHLPAGVGSCMPSFPASQAALLSLGRLLS